MQPRPQWRETGRFRRDFRNKVCARHFSPASSWRLSPGQLGERSKEQAGGKKQSGRFTGDVIFCE